MRKAKKGKKSYNSFHWSRESFSKGNHKMICLFLISSCSRAAAVNRLPLAERPPGELDHLLVSVGNQSNPVKHFREESCCVAPPRETKHVYVIPRGIVLHEKLIASHNMVGE